MATNLQATSAQGLAGRIGRATRRRREGGFGLDFETLRHAVTYFLVLAAFGSIFATGELDTLVSGAFMAAWVVGFFMRRPPAWWTPSIGFALTVLVLISLAFFARSGAFFSSILYLLLYLVLAKSYTLSKTQDYLQVQVLCFFMIVSTAVITVAFQFVFFFLAYVFLATIDLLLFGIALGRERVERAAAPGGAVEGSPSRLPVRFLASGWLGGVLILGLIIFFFLFIPHLSLRQINAPLSSRRTAGERLTGFSEEVTLGSFKNLQPDPTIVMHVEVDWPGGAERERPSHLRMRGVALDHFEAKRWRRTPRRGGPIEVRARRQIAPKIDSAQRGRVTWQTIYQNTDVTSRLFGGSQPMEIDLGRPLSVRYDERTGGAQITSFGGTRETAFTNPFVYRVKSQLVDEATRMLTAIIDAEKKNQQAMLADLAWINEPRFLRELSRRTERYHLASVPNQWLLNRSRFRLRPEERLINTRLPDIDLVQRVTQFSREEAPGPTDAEIMLQAVGHLRQSFQYSLEQNLEADEDPIEAFLFRTRSGHCEYFATALVLMLRTRGIPARLVNGFYTTEWNELGRFFVVKQSDAHSWVEAWLDGAGWLTLDPTPAGSAGRAAYGDQRFSLFSTWSEFLRIQWQRRVIDFSQDQQFTLLESIRSGAGIERALEAISRAPGRLLGAGKKQGATGEKQSPGGSLTWALDLVIALLLLFLGMRALQFVRRRVARGQGRSAIEYLNALVEKLQKLGWTRRPAQTPLELIGSLEVHGLTQANLDWIVSLYYRERFGGQLPTADEKRRAREIIRSLEVPAPRGAP